MKQLYIFLFLGLFFFSHSQTKTLIFQYDDAGNQILREYQSATSKVAAETTILQNIFSPQETRIYPNPVEAELTISWEPSLIDYIAKIELIAYNGTYVENVPFVNTESKTILDMTHRPSGVYYIKIYCSDGRVLSHSLIKN